VPAAIAAENNLAETAFVIPRADVSPLRWFPYTLGCFRGTPND
jgi:predicted PhzF superfamily epimerase YddE/YHI9